MRTPLAECSETHEVVFVQEIILLGCVSRNETVLFVHSTYIAQRAVPKRFEEGTPRELHCMVVSTSVGNRLINSSKALFRRLVVSLTFRRVRRRKTQ
jgi:hypothetical protein